MKTKLILTCAVVAISLFLFACSSQVSVEVSYDDFMKLQHISQEVEVAVDGSLIVTLESNPTTGFKWQYEEKVKDTLHILTGIPDETVLALIESKYQPGEKAKQDPPVPGAGGVEVWTFKAVGKGTTELSLEYSQPWEGGEKGEWTFNLTVVVK